MTSLLALAACAGAQTYTINTAAGGGLPPTPMSAKTAPVRPEWTTADSAGNVYFVSGRAVFKIDSTGTLTRVNPAVLAGQAFSGAARAVDAVNVQIGNWNVTPMFTGLSGAGLV